MRWRFPSNRPIPQWLTDYLKQQELPHTYLPVLGQLLNQVNPSFNNPKEVDQFLCPSLKNSEAPKDIINLPEAVQSIHTACKAHKRIIVVSDYDVDGVTSMTLMYRFFHYFQLPFTPVFPLRKSEGYGLTDAFIDRILKNHAPFDYLIAMDCGTNSTQAIQRINASGASAIIIDHHQPTVDPLPSALIVNPHVQPECHSASAQNLCTAGLVFKFIQYWRTLLKQDGCAAAEQLVLSSFLDLVALGTISDVVPLRGDNRLWVHFGLRAMERTPSYGLKTLLKLAGCSQIPTVEDIGFKIGPRINAGGRLDSATAPFELLTSDEHLECKALATKLDALNSQRKSIERQMIQEAEALIAHDPDQHAYVLYQPHWHTGIVGIVAGRLMHQHHCPIFVLGQQNELAKGSGRSIPGVDLVPLLTQAQPWIHQWGGHEAAVGLSTAIDQIPALEQSIRHYLKDTFPVWPQPTLNLSGILTKDLLTEDFLHVLDRLGPFGSGYEPPLFALPHIQLTQPPKRFGSNQNHLRLQWNQHSFVAWNYFGAEPSINQPIDCAIRLGWNYWANRLNLQIQLIDWRPSKSIDL